VGIIYISHRLEELQQIADRIVVLRDGAIVAQRPALAFTHDELVSAMIGHEAPRATAHPPRAADAELLRVENLSRAGCVSRVSLQLHAGEILGIAGLVGSGRTELLRLIFGADRKDAGEIYLNGGTRPAKIDSPLRAIAHGMGYVPEDRKSQGLLLSQSLCVNLTLAKLAAVSRCGWISAAREKSASELWAQRLQIRARDDQQTVAELSGGNQQKVLLARWLHRGCRILLLDEPTRGVDVGARAQIYAQLHEQVAAGMGLLVVSSDLRELMALCDRIAVMSAGELARVFQRGAWTEQALLDAAFSAYKERPGAIAAVLP